MKILKSFSATFFVLSLFGVIQCTMFYSATWFYSVQPLTTHNGDSSFFLLTLVWMLLMICLLFASNLLGMSKVEHSIEAFLEFCPSWMRLLFRGAFLGGFVHTVLCSITTFISIGDSRVSAIWYLRGSLGLKIYLYIWAVILFYSIICSKKSA